MRTSLLKPSGGSLVREEVVLPEAVSRSLDAVLLSDPLGCSEMCTAPVSGETHVVHVWAVEIEPAHMALLRQTVGGAESGVSEGEEASFYPQELLLKDLRAKLVPYGTACENALRQHGERVGKCKPSIDCEGAPRGGRQLRASSTKLAGTTSEGGSRPSHRDDRSSVARAKLRELLASSGRDAMVEPCPAPPAPCPVPPALPALTDELPSGLPVEPEPGSPKESTAPLADPPLLPPDPASHRTPALTCDRTANATYPRAPAQL